MNELSYWRKCTTCKRLIAFSHKYWVCNVSTCNRQRTGLVFCTVSCWDAHVPVMNHRDSWALEKHSPSRDQVTPVQSPSSAPKEFAKGTPVFSAPKAAPEEDILVVASKVKDYIRARAGMNTAGNVMGCLSDYVRKWSDQMIRHAEADNRKTVMDRDLKN